MSSYEERREEQRKYEADVWYDVWRSGGNPDAINSDRVRDHYYDNWQAEDSARAELRAQQPRPQEQEQIQEQEQFSDQ